MNNLHCIKSLVYPNHKQIILFYYILFTIYVKNKNYINILITQIEFKYLRLIIAKQFYQTILSFEDKPHSFTCDYQLQNSTLHVNYKKTYFPEDDNILRDGFTYKLNRLQPRAVNL